ncbi:MAG: RimK family protein [Rhodospirillum sp.]|nr:RimK family protein [Rhodospirillum sp.]
MVVILTERKPDSFPPAIAALVRAPRSYITQVPPFPVDSTRILDLTTDCSYLGMAYYASLLAEARGHKVLPGVDAIVNLNRGSVRRLLIRELNEALRTRMVGLGAVEPNPFTLFIAFGATPDSRFGKFARQIWEAFQFPLLRVAIHPDPKHQWKVDDIDPVSAKALGVDEETFFQAQLAKALKGEWKPPKPRKTARWSLAVLYNEADPLRPSDKGALRKLARAAERRGMEVDIIGKGDLGRLAQFDALFIRETTNVNHHTFTFARAAEAEGMPVIDDPQSILRCTNKVYLAELLNAHGLPTPDTRVLDRRLLTTVDRHLDYPIVLKVPDGSFSRGVVKVDTREALLKVGRELLSSSDLILAQEFLPTSYDWRIGVLNGQPLFACQYLMSRKHWQIVNHKADGTVAMGGFHTLDVDEAPPEVITLALRSAALMGNGLYGVDIKQTDRGCVVIEVNDNPSLDSGVEDKVLKDQLYNILVGEFIRRLEEAQG